MPSGTGISSEQTRRTGASRRPKACSAISAAISPPSAADCYRFVLTHPRVHVACCGPASMGELRQNLECLERGPMSDEELERMRRIGRHVYQSGAPWKAQLGSIAGIVSRRLRGSVGSASS